MSGLLVEQVVGQPSAKIWSQVSINPVVTQGQAMTLARPGLLLVMQINQDDGEAAEVGKQLLQRVSQEWSAVHALTPTTVNQLIHSLVSIAPTISVAGVAAHQQQVFLLSHNGGQIVIRRDAQIGVVCRSNPGEQSILAGAWQAGDRYLIGTQQLVAGMSETFMADVLNQPDLVAAKEELATTIQAQGESHTIAGLLIEVEPDSPKTKSSKEERQGQQRFLRLRKLLPTRSGKPRVYLRREPSSKVAFSVGTVLLVLLLVSLAFGWRQRQQQALVDAFEAVAVPAQENLNRAWQLYQLNPLEARRLLVESKHELESALPTFAQHPNYQAQLTSQLEKLSQAQQQMMGVQSIDELTPWFDLGLIHQGFFGQQLVVDRQNLIILDANSGQVATLAIDSKQGGLVGGGGLLQEAKHLSASAGRVVVTSTAGVVEVSLGQKTTAVLVPPNQNWQRLAGVGLYAGSVYLVDAGADELWRFAAANQGVGSASRWFKPGVEPSLAGVIDMVIDGDIWLLSQDGSLARYRQGSQLNFSLSGLEQSLGEVVAITTQAETENLYILDPTHKRIIAVDKTGEYQQQYTWDGLATASDIAVAPEANLLFALSGSHIFALPLQP